MRATLQNKAGMTLIEVLIALAIISIALTAIVKVTAQTIRNTLYLQNKMIATWVGTNVINEIRVGVIQLPTSPDPITRNTTMLGQRWAWQAIATPTPNPRIKKIDVTVSQENAVSQLTQLTSYLYVAQSS